MMAPKTRLARSIALAFAVAAVLLMCAGCKTMDFNSGTSSSARAASPDPSPVYYDFDDVLIPQELKMDKDSCFVYKASGIAAGVLVLSGRVEVNSLIAFFENNMIKDNWAMVSMVRSPRSLMLFRKENRTCVITVRTSPMNTQLEIWVAPSNEMAAGAGLLKETGLAE